MGFKCGCYARVSDSDPRAEDWKAIFGEPRFPLKSPLKQVATLQLKDGVHDMEFYPGDPARLTGEQMERLIAIMQNKFGVSRKTVTDDIEREACIPVKAENVTVAICRNHVMAML